MPEFLWDAEKGAVKIDSVKDIAARIAADDVRKGSLPQTPEAYKAELPADFVPPAGVEFKIDVNDPMIAQARTTAHAEGMTQDGFSKLLGIYAAAKVGEQAQIDAARTAEIGKLGATAPARVDAVTRWMDTNDLGVLKNMLVTAAHVEAFEKFITRSVSQGSASFRQTGRDVDTGKVAPEVYEKMSYSDKKAYAAKHSGQAA